ncbi:DUF2336 domain-containing protein [Kordiimonas sp. SCSIO 12610]|uniref:DUF2336 domain-containing protein n=1 Tax=Kordiimonas sp. SCSIO 12610 TaxID=2829597 RepID=UPI00210AA9A7|nr:DUF2336 domain-containing protein [Kordiimonas sp. SCSIO 12610]UTW56592.1 DUF2336 domain-containing protein [Kordiimonas sp. SCSIO 12610]
MVSNELQNLLLLARSKSSDARSRLLENISDLFLSDAGRLSEHERALMSDILSKLISQVEKDIRKELANILQQTGGDFPDVVKLLANDDVDIARPLLEKSNLLKDPDLIEIIRMRTDEHRMSVAMRDELSEQVTDALIEYGNDDVLETLLNNHDTTLSKRTMEYMVAESRRVDRFQEPLLMRADLPGDLAYKMYWWVSAALRKRIVTEFEVEPVQFERMVRRAANSVITEQTNEQSSYVRAQKLVRRMYENGELSIQFLISTLRQQRVAVFVAGTAELAGISFRTAWRIFSDNGGESFAVLAKAIGMDRSQFTSIFLLLGQVRGAKDTKSPGFIKSILELFDAITEQNARGAVQIWQREGAYQEAIEELDNAVGQ